MFAPVFEAVCGCARASRPAMLPGYARHPVRGHDFPGIVKTSGACTEGVLLDRIDDSLWRCLDTFESDFYERIEVEVTLTDSRRESAQTYVVRAQHLRHLDGGDWSPSRFEQTALKRYLERYT